jgi:hypothetical protein
MRRQFLVTILSIQKSARQESSVPCGQPGGHDKAISRCSQLNCEAPKNWRKQHNKEHYNLLFSRYTTTDKMASHVASSGDWTMHKTF